VSRTFWTSTILGTWGRPADEVAWAALGAAIAFMFVALAPRAVLQSLGVDEHLPKEARRRLLAGVALLAAFLSLGYVAFYLRGGPRVIDATSYFLEARGIAHGSLAWAVPSPSASFRGRFLLFHEPAYLSVIFPPGYPLLLAVGFLVGAPMVVGPLLAAGLAYATYLLARELGEPMQDGAGHPRPSSGCPRAPAVATLAALFSLVSAALRYHTADTMAHGASALGIALAMSSALRGWRLESKAGFALSGLALGWVFATRPVSSFAVAIAVLALAVSSRRPGAVLSTLAAALPGILFFLLAQRLQTGSWLTSSQGAYYAVSDGPSGCFRYGFGKDTGCVFEHGDFVRSHLADGYGLVAALGTTGRRLKAHLIDPLNFEPLILLVLWPLFGRMRTHAGLALAVVAGQILAYLPFYFDGNYPGGGARFFADVLPVEHALAAMAVSLILPRVSLLRKSLFVLSLACAGFALHGVFDHIALANRDGGRPMYEPDVTRDAQVTRGVLFFETDHGYNLAAVPGAEPEHAIVAARLRGDDHDRLLVERLNHPQAHVYRFGSEGASVSGWTTYPTSVDFWRFEAEADWPPLFQSGGWAEPIWMTGTCASQDRALTLHGSESGLASTTIDLPVERDGHWLVTPRVIHTGGRGRGVLRLEPLGRPPLPEDATLVWDWMDVAGSGPEASRILCTELVPRETSLLAAPGAGARWVLTSTGGDVTLDRTTMRFLR
jgi:hypothetical protein